MVKLKAYFKEVFHKFGIVVPVISISVLFVISIVFDLNNIISIFFKKSTDAFIAIAAIFGVSFILHFIMTILKIKSKDITFYDLFIVIFMGISFLMIALFLCLPANGWLSVLKYAITIFVFGAMILISFFRSKYLVIEENDKNVK